MGELKRHRGYESSREHFEEQGNRRAVALVLAGMAIGAGLALLLTPKSGPELRQAIGRGYRKAVEELTGRTHDLRDAAHNLGDDLLERWPNVLRFGRRKRPTLKDSGV